MQHPFPLSEATEKKLSMGQLFAPWSALDDYPEREGDPHFLTCLHHWHRDTKGLLEVLKDRVILGDIDQDTLFVMLRTLDLRFEQLWSVIQWTDATWRDDPAIKGVGSKDDTLTV